MNENKGLQKSAPLSTIPTVDELFKNTDDAFYNDKLNLLLNQPPHAKWVIEHPIIKKEIPDPAHPGLKLKVPLQYLPIDKVEYMLTRIFQEWKVEVLREGALFNSVYATIRLHYKRPDGVWMWHDGSGAVAVQLDADRADKEGVKVFDLRYIKADAVQKALPAAISYAIKDAADHIGKIFGRDMNRNTEIPFVPGYATEEDPDYTQRLELTDQIKTEIELADTTEEVSKIWSSNKQFQSNPEFINLIMARKEKIS